MEKRRIVIAIVAIVAVVGLLIGIKLFNVLSNHGIAGSGTIEATEVQIGSQTAGEVLERFFDEGDKVKKGDILVKVDPKNSQARYDQAVAIEKAAAIRFELSFKEFKRAGELFANRMISDQKNDEVTSSYRAAQADLDQASASKRLAKIALDNAVVTSPIDGVILSKNIEKGELVSIGLPLFTLADLNEVYLKIFVPETEVGKIKLGQNALVFVDSFPGKGFPGTVTFISDQAEFTPKNIQTQKERLNQVFAVKIKIQNPDQLLKPGMPADAKLGN
ncbi:MAG: efflux RND transporter periplasmic adaptor subunit [Candidatus Saganbacteria bacterium]|nr:efflux RND transporter periplasmic adaptor subunit [Candidatus Saganbacteria bacterium]